MALIYTVPQSHCVVLERLGRFNRVQKEGLHFRIPILDHIRRVSSWGDTANKRGFIIELTEQQTDTPARVAHTRDNVPVTANASVYWRITDPRKALYEVDVMPRAIADVTLNALRSNVGKMDLDTALSERQNLNQSIEVELADTGEKWGVVITRVEIQELTTDERVANSMTQQMDAERRRRATVADAEGKAEAEIKIADAEKRAAVLRAQGQAEAIESIARAERAYLEALTSVTDRDTACKALVAQKYIDGFREITKNPSDKVFVPNNFGAMFGFDSGSGPSGGNNEASLDNGHGRAMTSRPHGSANGHLETEADGQAAGSAGSKSAGDAEFESLR